MPKQNDRRVDEDFEVQDDLIEQRRISDSNNMRRIRNYFIGLAVLMESAVLSFPMKQVIFEEFIYPIAHGEAVEAEMRKKIQAFDDEKKERESIARNVHHQLQQAVDSQGALMENLSPAHREIFEKEKSELEKLWLRRGKNIQDYAAERRVFLSELYKSFETEDGTIQPFADSFLKINYLVEGYDKSEYEDAVKIWGQDIVDIKKATKDVNTTDKLAAINKKFIPETTEPTIKSNLIDAVRFGYEPEETTCFGYSSAASGAIMELMPELRDDIYFQFFGDHVRTVVEVGGKKITLDKEGLGSYDDNLTRDYDNTLIRVRDWLAIAAGHDKGKFKIITNKGQKNDKKPYPIVLDARVQGLVDLGLNAPINSVDEYYGDRNVEDTHSVETVQVQGRAVTLKGKVLNRQILTDALKRIKAPMTNFFIEAKIIDPDAMKYLKEQIISGQIRFDRIIFSKLSVLEEDVAQEIAKLTSRGWVEFSNLRELNPKIAKALFLETTNNYNFRHLFRLDKQTAEAMVYPAGRNLPEVMMTDSTKEIDLQNSDFDWQKPDAKVTANTAIRPWYIHFGNLLHITPEAGNVLANFPEEIAFENTDLNEDMGKAFSSGKATVRLMNGGQVDGFLSTIQNVELALYQRDIDDSVAQKIRNAHLKAMSIYAAPEKQITTHDIGTEETSPSIKLEVVYDQKDISKQAQQFIQSAKNYKGSVGFAVDALNFITPKVCEEVVSLSAKTLFIDGSGINGPRSEVNVVYFKALAKFPREIGYRTFDSGGQKGVLNFLEGVSEHKGDVDLRIKNLTLTPQIIAALEKLLQNEGIGTVKFTYDNNTPEIHAALTKIKQQYGDRFRIFAPQL